MKISVLGTGAVGRAVAGGVGVLLVIGAAAGIVRRSGQAVVSGVVQSSASCTGSGRRAMPSAAGRRSASHVP